MTELTLLKLSSSGIYSSLPVGSTDLSSLSGIPGGSLTQHSPGLLRKVWLYKVQNTHEVN